MNFFRFCSKVHKLGLIGKVNPILHFNQNYSFNPASDSVSYCLMRFLLVIDGHKNCDLRRESISLFTCSYHRPKKGNRLHLNRRGVGKSPDGGDDVNYDNLDDANNSDDGNSGDYFVVLYHLQHIRSP